LTDFAKARIIHKYPLQSKPFFYYLPQGGLPACADNLYIGKKVKFQWQRWANHLQLRNGLNFEAIFWELCFALNEELQMSEEINMRIDVSGVCCPLPLIQLAKSVNHLKPGETLEIIGNDPIFESSVRDFCQANGHEILKVFTDASQGVSMLIRVGA
jgi:TusA-related sulfurtransferase